MSAGQLDRHPRLPVHPRGPKDRRVNVKMTLKDMNNCITCVTHIMRVTTDPETHQELRHLVDDLRNQRNDALLGL
jgi:hypothetical protein